MAKCVECREEDHFLRIVPISYCEHRLCLEFRREDCLDIHLRTCATYCRSVGRTPEPHPRDLARQAEEAAQPQQLDLFAEL
ncbi:hypothetical protein GBF35_25650 [Nonomuraea phyllanthi]|uniref:hypothetical protein n=1 Tax=Nonomuraea phyllanthi TaxID=2219224 RepID=UPI001293648C|nr:hypothetical protein [Nonomuraea phyllanthi]QFY09585.1 hypothetical protein GBF35_25650 [Nonomuraea phyllanthi]